MFSDSFYQTIETQYGPVKGIKKFGCYGDEYFSFQGIPYMKPPVGKLRFRDAQSPDNWTEVLDCTSEGPSFVNRNYITGKMEGQLDAMQINIYTKNIKPDNLKPVMVFIHGGGFYSGSARTDMYGPDYLIQKDVILVTFNYRLGIFGFLSLNDKKLNIPGNAGLKDQTFALKWIKRNIKNFGGDPSNVTIFGESAGGCSVHFHTISNHSKGLFQKAIPMSGCSLIKIWSTIPNLNWAQKIAMKLGWDGVGGEEKVLEILENSDPFDIVKLHAEVQEDPEEIVIEPYGPNVEPYITENCFIPKDPVLMAREAWGNDIDMMIGGCSNEGLFLMPYFKEFEKIHETLSIERYVATEFGLKKDDPKRNDFGSQIKKLYYGCTEPSESNLVGYFEFLTDVYFWYGIYRSILSRANSEGAGQTYVYRFDYDYPNVNIAKTLAELFEFSGASHLDDLTYLFKSEFLPAPAKETKEYEAIKKMAGIFTTFASSGDPNCEELEGVKFDPITYKKAPIKCFQISDDCQNIELPQNERFSVWDKLYKQENFPIF